MAKAVWNGKVIAESDEIIKIFNRFYFPVGSVKKEFLKLSNKTTSTFWNGILSYYSIVVDGKENHDAAFYLNKSGEIIKQINDKICFHNNVEIIL